ncbi:MAG: hypothetical protein Homavirus3_15, partial [Homavirus sp.]
KSCLSQICFKCRKIINYKKYTNVNNKKPKTIYQIGKNVLRKPPIRICDFDINKYQCGKMDRESERSMALYHAPITYDNEPFIFQTDPIRLTEYYCLPGLGFVKKIGNPRDFTNREHAYMRLLLDKDQLNCVNLENMLNTISAHMDSTLTKSKIMGKFAKLYKNEPIVKKRYIDEDEDDDSDEDYVMIPRYNQRNKNNKNKINKQSDQYTPKYCKLRFSLSYPERDINTLVFIKDNDKTTQIYLKNIIDFEKYLKVGNKVSMVIRPSAWFNKVKNHNGNKIYSIKLVIMQIHIELLDSSKNIPSVKDIMSKYNFIDDNNQIVDLTSTITDNITDTVDKIDTTDTTDTTDTIDIDINTEFIDCSIKNIVDIEGQYIDHDNNVSCDDTNSIFPTIYKQKQVLPYYTYHDAKNFDDLIEILKVNICDRCVNKELDNEFNNQQSLQSLQTQPVPIINVDNSSDDEINSISKHIELEDEELDG